MINNTNARGESEAISSPNMVHHEWEQPFQPSVTIVEAVAAATGRTEMDLPPLQKHIDPDALDAMISREKSSEVTISFRYAGTVVVIDGDGAIEVRVSPE